MYFWGLQVLEGRPIAVVDDGEDETVGEGLSWWGGSDVMTVNKDAIEDSWWTATV